MSTTQPASPTSGSGGPTPSAPPPEHLAHVVFIAAAAAIGGFLFGYDSAVINGAVPAIKDKFDIGGLALGQVIAIALIGCALGAMLAGRLADRIGRIRVMQISAVLFAASAVGSSLPFALWDLAAWRFVGGIAIGIASVIGPAYIAEIAPPAYRGRLAAFQQMAIVLGIAVSQLVNWGINESAGGKERGQLGGLEAWQWMLMACVVPAVLYFMFSLMIPESPRFLIQTGRDEQAAKILREVEGSKIDTTARIQEIRTLMASDHKSSFGDLRGGSLGMLAVVWIGIGMAVFQQFVGINVIFYYSSTLWQSVGIDTSNSLLISLSTSIINIIGTIIAMIFIDRFGRKPLALIGSVGMTISLGMVAVAFGQAQSSGSGDSKKISLDGPWDVIAIVAAHSFVLFFALSWGVVLWVLLGEFFPNRIRAAAIGVATAANWIANWAITASFPSLADWSLAGSYWIYTICAALSFVFVKKFIKETKGMRLEEMG